MAFEELYARLMASAPLLDRHREELVQKRGLSQDSIRKFRFGSGGSHLRTLEDDLMREMAIGTVQERDLVISGVFIHDGKQARMNPVLLREEHTINNRPVSNILIPYVNLKGGVYLVRPHKMGFGGVPIEVWQESNLVGKPAEIILTEGEFKAAAGCQYGFPTLAVPGISSFSEKEWPRLLKMLSEHEIKRVVIMFDNETKDDPALPGYKENPYDRYDTPFYAYYMASRIERDAKIEAVIATLPEGWKVDGKIDIDGAAAQLKSAGEMKKVVYDALPRNEYLSELDPDAKQAVLRKMNQKYHRAKVKREFNRYVVMRQRGKTTWEEPISNFVLRVIATHDTPEGVKREVEFVNEFGKKSAPFTIDSDGMSGSDAFRAFALSKGDFIWRGMTEDLLTIWESEFLMMDEGRYIVESDHVGWVEREKVWLFGNVAVKDDGSELRPDASGIFWLEKRGIKPVPITAGNKNAAPEGVPYLSLGATVDIKEVKVKFSETIGHNETCVLLGWIAAVAFMEDVFRIYRSFPFLFITGRWQSGKSTIAEWAANFFGIENAGKSISQTTAVAIQRCLAYYSCLPVCLDEYRNTKDVVHKNGFLRNVYNRQSAGKGIKDSDYALRDAKVRGTLLLAGEETPKDGAVLSRCIVVFVSRQKRIKNHFSWFMANRMKFSSHFLSILRRRGDLILPFFEAMTEWKEFFTAQGIDDRMAINYCTVVAGHTVVFGKDDLGFAEWLIQETKSVQLEQGEEQAVNLFLDDLGALKTRKMVGDDYWAISEGKVYIYFHGLHQVWSEQFRKTRGDEAFKEASIRAYLKEEPGFIDSNVPYRIKGQVKKCVVFDYQKASEEIKNLVEPLAVAHLGA